MSVHGDHFYKFLSDLSFVRVSGTEEEHKAANMIMEEIKSYGLEPKLEPFEVSHRKPVNAKFVVTSPEVKEYTVTGLINAGDTPVGGTDAEFYYMESINPFSLQKGKGKFVLLNARPSEEEYKQLMETGIAGFLWLNGTARDTYENSDLDTMRYRASYHRYGEVPAFAIRMIDAMDLVRSNPKTVHFELQHEEWKGTSYNVVTVVPGTDKADEAICVGGHYDSVEFSKGSWDNGAGTVQVLGLLQHLAKNPPRRTVKAVCFGSEEIGLNGSKAYLAAHPEDRDSLLCMINLDVGGSALGHYMAGITATPEAEHYLTHLLRECGWWIDARSGVMSSDCAVFSDWGIPSISLGRMTPSPYGGFMHTRYDNMDMISADVLGEEIDILVAVADRLLSAEIFPIQRKISDEMTKEIVKYFGTGNSHTWEVQNPDKVEKK